MANFQLCYFWSRFQSRICLVACSKRQTQSSLALQTEKTTTSTGLEDRSMVARYRLVSTPTILVATRPEFVEICLASQLSCLARSSITCCVCFAPKAQIVILVGIHIQFGNDFCFVTVTVFVMIIFATF